MKLKNLLPDFQFPLYHTLEREVGPGLVISESNRFFDKDGFQLTALERAYHERSGVSLSSELNHTSVAWRWFEQEGPLRSTLDPYTLVLDHAFLSMRYSYGGAALSELDRHGPFRPELHKLASIKPKWGLDLSIDLVGHERCMEVMHLEYDFELPMEAIDLKRDIEAFFDKGIQWDWHVDKILQQRSRWAGGRSDDISDWLARYWGFPRAFSTLKIWR